MTTGVSSWADSTSFCGIFILFDPAAAGLVLAPRAMRFGRALRESQVPQWRQYYCDYDKLRQCIIKCEAERERDSHVLSVRTWLSPVDQLSLQVGQRIEEDEFNSDLQSEFHSESLASETWNGPLEAIAKTRNSDVEFASCLVQQADIIEEFYHVQVSCGTN